MVTCPKANMTWLLLNIPFMLVGVAIAIGPLLYQQRRDAKAATESSKRFTEEVLADLDDLPISPATHRRMEKTLAAGSH